MCFPTLVVLLFSSINANYINFFSDESGTKRKNQEAATSTTEYAPLFSAFSNKENNKYQTHRRRRTNTHRKKRNWTSFPAAKISSLLAASSSWSSSSVESLQFKVACDILLFFSPKKRLKSHPSLLCLSSAFLCNYFAHPWNSSPLMTSWIRCWEFQGSEQSFRVLMEGWIFFWGSIFFYYKEAATFVAFCAWKFSDSRWRCQRILIQVIL